MVDGLNVTSVTEQFSQLSFEEAALVLEPLIIFLIGMIIYAVFVHRFYKFISKKEIFSLYRRGKAGFLFQYIIVFPLTVFLWFYVISALLAVLSQTLAIADIYLIAMALTATIRFAAYYDEDLSRDIAQLIPFSLLAIFLLSISEVSVSTVFFTLRDLPFTLSILVYYFTFLVVLELLLKLVFDAILWKPPKGHRITEHSDRTLLSKLTSRLNRRF